MDRNQFIKKLGLASTGLIMFPDLSFGSLETEANPDNFENSKLLMPMNTEVIDVTIDANSEFMWGWLLRTVGSALISSLVGNIVEKYFGKDCYCNGTSCSVNNAPSSNYSNAVGYYGYNTHNQKFLTQQIYDSTTSFENASVPFLNSYGRVITNVEGPFLAGLCLAAKDIASQNGIRTARNVIVPYAEISNGGYRFDTRPCYPTVLATNYGKTAISYTPNGNNGFVKVDVFSNKNNLPDYSQTWKVNAV
ncbi:hypothetical protein [Chryseobacterium gambrini]|uniref:Uncharacterized protein n=1 Tax=Chryseobacterium gambrini TaxID=373672 RepID=A0A1N7JUU1_9FLAO|nr:hypothetical protein [Chryseobacterium gambrini]SIS53108.1 hypothetical protein SAMN05421785_101117 [Chryseobacterium gambrini]